MRERHNTGEPGQRLSDSRLANLGANAIFAAFSTFQNRFRRITRRAQQRYLARDWRGLRADSRARLELYRKAVDQVVVEVRDLLQDRAGEKLVWASMKAVYSGLIASRDDWEVAETFFNSVTRRLFATVGVDPQIEFVDSDYDAPPNPGDHTEYVSYERAADTVLLVRTILLDQPFQDVYANLERDAHLVSREIEKRLRAAGALRVVERVDLAHAIFYRGQGAYLVGRLFSGSHQIPLVLALAHDAGGVYVDAVLLDENDVSILFSFTRSYFHVDVDRPYDLIRFLRTIMPRKRVAELYISIGYNKHGKTELYRDILHHMAYSDDQFQKARGQPGMVMSVFTMPSYDIVFKVIKDRFTYPKKTTRAAVMEKYHLVFRHDRAGRLVDAQEFEHLQFDRGRFSAALLDDLMLHAEATISVTEAHVTVKHAYVERRIIPLDIYVREADEEMAVQALIDYGNAIKDLAISNIFPGDMLLKNFGVTRHGRVVFYDYDELCLLTDCNFRDIPPAPSYEDELSPEPWFSINEHDVFPEQFVNFLGVYGEIREVFLEHHRDLLDPAYWRAVQARLAAGEIMQLLPYREAERLCRKYPDRFVET